MKFLFVCTKALGSCQTKHSSLGLHLSRGRGLFLITPEVRKGRHFLIHPSDIVPFSNIPAIQFSSVQSLSHARLSATPWIAARQASLSSPTPRVHPDPCPLSRWCHPTILSSVVPSSSRLQSFPASGSFLMSQFFTSGGRSIGVSASTSVLTVNTQDWSPLGWTGLIFLQSKGLSRVFSSTTVQNHNSSVLSFLYSPTLPSIHDYWKNHSFD